jgi:hypothetical protein
MADMPHYCSACGEVHGGSAGKDPAVEIAKINAERDIRVAELARGESKKFVEGQIEQTGIEASAAVEEAVVKAEVLEELAEPEPEPEPVVIVSNEAEGGAAPEPEPEADLPEAGTVPAAAGKSNPWW